MEEKKNAFEAQAHIMAQWMDSMPDVEQMIAKSIQQLCTSNYQYHKSVIQILNDLLLYPENNYLIKQLNKEHSTPFYYKSTVLQNQNHSLHEININTMSVVAAFIFFFMVVMPEINAEPSELDEAKNYIYQSDIQSGRGNFRKVLEVRNVDTSEGLSLTIDALPTTCPVSSKKSLEEVYSDECRITKDEYDKIECHLKLDQSKSGQIECTYYAV
ncbi:hypothetical protein T12_1034 [Trichinella patagoniensis]|uniref:Uncharacterized protein n=1 Tax=Trichinella patagoniensis TaxID=990121 RepID=A0A0V0Z6S8_9BILA|nr:hypothetical protein T12_1034 [Trichinella patagoniensis]